MFRYLLLACLIFLVSVSVTGCGKKNVDVADDPTEVATEIAPVEEVVPEEIEIIPEPEPEVSMEEQYSAMAPQDYGIEDVFFEFDQYTLSSEAMATLDAVARIMREYSGIDYVIEGHCDERGTVEYNLALGEKRSLAVRDYLVSLGISSYRLRLTSYGEERPFAEGSNESAWAMNRRAHFARP